jgi:hypothetical protein
VSVDEHKGEQHFLDATIAYRRACLNAIEYLKKFGYTGEQAYMILGTAPVEGRISGIVDIPNACATLAVPTGIFDFDIHRRVGPKEGGLGFTRQGQLTDRLLPRRRSTPRRIGRACSANARQSSCGETTMLGLLVLGQGSAVL